MDVKELKLEEGAKPMHEKENKKKMKSICISGAVSTSKEEGAALKENE